MIRIIFLALIFVACLLNWIFISLAAKSAMHETTGAVIGLSALVALSAAFICDTIRSAKQTANRDTESLGTLLRALHRAQEGRQELTEQNRVLSAQAERDHALQVATLIRQQIHTNELLKWLGELKSTPPQS